MAAHAARGGHVILVTCTLGEEGEVIPSELRGLAADAADQLGGHRLGELRAASAALGVTDQRFLGGIGRWRDSGMAGTPSAAHPRAFSSVDPAPQIDALVAIMRETRPEVVITYAADGGYGHPDHIRAHEITMAAVESLDRGLRPDRVFHTVNARTDVEHGLAELAGVDQPWRLPDPGELPTVADDLVTTTIDISAHRPAKLAALRAHATQISVFDGPPPVFALSNGIAQPIPPVERYIQAAGETPAPVDDLFGGVTIGARG